jgi:hypothetical protein
LIRGRGVHLLHLSMRLQLRRPILLRLFYPMSCPHISVALM